MPRRKHAPAKRLFIAQRAEFLCEYCHTPEDFSPDTFNIEHIISLFQGGSNDDENLALACGGCNSNKHVHTTWNDPETGLSLPIFHPRTDHWSAHFSWSDDFTLLSGLTPTGRATIELLQMNRQRLVNLRQALLAHDAHPGK
jgi:HNH endonuclease